MHISKNVFKAIVRDIYQRKTRSFTIFISISIIIIFPVGFINSGTSLGISLNNESNDSNLAHLEIFFPSITNATIQDIKNLTDPISIDGRLRITGIIDNKLVNEQKQEVFIISYPENASPTVNIPKIAKSPFKGWSLANLTTGNCAFLESFAQFMGIKIGDIIQVKGNNKILSLNVTTFVTSVEFMSYNLLGNGVIYVSYQDALQMSGLNVNAPQSQYNDIVMYFGSSDAITTDYLKQKVKLIQDKYDNSSNPLSQPLFIWFTQKSSVRASLADGTVLASEYLGGAASFAVLVTGFVIYIIMNRYVQEEKKLIGVYQAFGFSRNEIIFIYACRTLLISIGSIIFGTIGAWLVLDVIVSTLANLWGITEITLVINPLSLFFFWFLTIAIALLFAMIPAFQVANLTPHESLREIKKIGITGKGALSRWTGKLPSVPKMSLRTLSRNRVRTLLTVIAIISSMALSIALLSALSSVNYTVDNYFQNTMVNDGRIEYFQPQNNTELSYVRSQQGVLEAEPNYYYMTNPLEDISEVVSVRGIEENSTTYIPDFLEKDPNFTFTYKNGTFTNYALVSERVLNRLNLHVGNTLKVIWKPGGNLYPNLTFKIGGMIRDLEYSIGVYVSLNYLREHLVDPINYFTSITIKLSTNIDKKAFMNNQLNRPKISYVNYIETIRARVDRIINSQIFIVSITVLLGFLVSFISVFNTQYITLIERDRDISIMLAFGYNRRFFLLEFLFEIIILVPISVIFAIIASRPIAQFFLNLIEDKVVRMDYYLGQSEIMFSMVFVLITAFVAAVIPAFYFVNTKRIAKILKADE